MVIHGEKRRKGEEQRWTVGATVTISSDKILWHPCVVAEGIDVTVAAVEVTCVCTSHPMYCSALVLSTRDVANVCVVVYVVVCATRLLEVAHGDSVLCSVPVVPARGVDCGAAVLCSTRKSVAVMMCAVLCAVARGVLRASVVPRCGGACVGICILSGLHLSNWAVIPAVREFFSYVPNGVV